MQPSSFGVDLRSRLDPDAVLILAAALEHGSQHPLAQAIIREAERRDLTLPPLTDFEALHGYDIRGRVNGQMLYLGNERFAHERGVCTPASEASLGDTERQGQTAVLLFSDAQPLGIVALADEIRSEAAVALRSLRWAGARRIVMLTGDNVETAEAVSQRLGIDDLRAELMPEEKVDMIRQLEASGQRVAFVGDGVNDAPALAAATVGIAMGAAGSDVALETADIALMSNDLSRLAFAVQISRKTSRIIRQNIVFSILIKVVFIFLALFGWATLWMAVAADMGASLAVILNGLRALGSIPDFSRKGAAS